MLSGTWRRGWRCLAPRVHHPSSYSYYSNHQDGCNAPRRCGFSTTAGQRKSWFPFSSSSGDSTSPFFQRNTDKQRQEQVDELLDDDGNIGRKRNWRWATEEERQKFVNAHEEEKKAEEEERKSQVDDRLKHLTVEERHLMKKFAFRLELAQKHPKKYDRQVWHYFRRIALKDYLVNLLGDVAWSYMWKLESQDVPLKRRIDLVDTMLRCEVPISEKHARAYIEALFWHGERDRAMQVWENQLEDSESLKWWNLGVKMFATEMDPATAERVADDAVKKLGVANAMTYTPVVISYHSMIEATGVGRDSKQAKDLNADALRNYQKLKKYAASMMKEQEYLRIAASFIDTDNPRDGLKVYEDMAHYIPKVFDELSRDQLNTTLDSLQNIQSSVASEISRKGKEFHQGHLVRVTDRIMKLIPDNFKDPVICGNWVRSLAKISKVDAAMRTMKKLREELKCNFATGTYNAILGGMTRADRIKDFNQLGVAMISQAAMRVRRRREMEHKDQSEAIEAHISSCLKTLSSVSPLSTRHRKDAHLQSSEQAGENLLSLTIANAPPADDGTFGICYRHYVKGSNSRKLVAVLDLMSACEIPPTITLLNHLLRALLRREDYAGIWATFTARRGGFEDRYIPNLKTYKVLWEGMNRQHFSFAPRKEYGMPREIFRLMIEDGVSATVAPGVKPDRKVYNLIIKSFFKHGDLIGGFVALNAAHGLWGVAPGITSIGNLIKGCCRVRSFDHHIGGAMHKRTYRGTRHRAAEWLGKWAGPPLEKGISGREQKWKWRTKRLRDWEEGMKDLPIHERPYYKYAPKEKDLLKEDEETDGADDDPKIVKQLGKLCYGVDDVVPDAEDYLRKMWGFLVRELEKLQVQRDWDAEFRKAVDEMGLTYAANKMPVVKSLLGGYSRYRSSAWQFTL